MTRLGVTIKKTVSTEGPEMIGYTDGVMLTNYLATLVMTFSTEVNHPTNSPVAQVPIFITSAHHATHIAIQTPFISAINIHSATHPKHLLCRTQLQRGVHSPLPTELI